MDPENYPPADHNMHLRMLHGLSTALDGWVTSIDGEVHRVEKVADDSDDKADALIDLFYQAEFAELARSHAFVCTITAFLESLFKKELPEVGARFQGDLNAQHPRVIQFGRSQESIWHVSRPENGSIVKNIVGALEASRLISMFGANFATLLEATFGYRNKMVHHGYEWPPPDRQEFAQRMADNGWSHWFAITTSGDQPWLFSVTAEYQRAALEVCSRSYYAIENLIVGDDTFLAFYSEQPPQAGSAAGPTKE